MKSFYLFLLLGAGLAVPVGTRHGSKTAAVQGGSLVGKDGDKYAPQQQENAHGGVDVYDADSYTSKHGARSMDADNANSWQTTSKKLVSAKKPTPLPGYRGVNRSKEPTPYQGRATRYVSPTPQFDPNYSDDPKFVPDETTEEQVDPAQTLDIYDANSYSSRRGTLRGWDSGNSNSWQINRRRRYGRYRRPRRSYGRYGRYSSNWVDEDARYDQADGLTTTDPKQEGAKDDNKNIAFLDYFEAAYPDTWANF
mmetsp:Transcript_15516/g.30478  ORF Transcript_15516/g.30478 Transcript_15516/m.30478 type:complete len:252 (-) Transcript_15516:34-789(-)